METWVTGGDIGTRQKRVRLHIDHGPRVIPPRRANLSASAAVVMLAGALLLGCGGGSSPGTDDLYMQASVRQNLGPRTTPDCIPLEATFVIRGRTQSPPGQMSITRVTATKLASSTVTFDTVLGGLTTLWLTLAGHQWQTPFPTATTPAPPGWRAEQLWSGRGESCVPANLQEGDSLEIAVEAEVNLARVTFTQHVRLFSVY